ncbi:MAG: ribosome silencing factor [Pseudomonadota bacterium]
MQLDALKALTIEAIEDIKAFDIKVIDVQGRNSLTDTLIFASARSDRQAKAIANNIIEKSKHAGVQPIGVEGMQTGDWVLVDLGDIIVHIMLPQVRDFYNIEKLWEIDDKTAESSN